MKDDGVLVNHGFPGLVIALCLVWFILDWAMPGEEQLRSERHEGPG